MKKIYSMMLVAAAAMAFVSCQKQENFAPEVSTEEVVLTFASEKPAFDDETKTEWTGTDIQWSAGDKISVAYTVNGNWQNASGDASEEASARLYKSDPLETAAETAKFNVSTNFKGTTEGAHVFYGIYPAPSNAEFAEAPVATLTVPSIQTPGAASFDGSADLMTGVSVGEFTSRPAEGETISMKWTRLVAHANITLKALNGVTAGETVSSIKLTAQEDANLVGSQKVNLLTNEVECNNNESNVIDLMGGNLSISAEGNIEFWACFLPTTLTSLKVEVETNKASYTREITGIEKTFKQNARNILSIKMDEATRMAKEEESWVLVTPADGLTEGTYVLVVSTDTKTGSLVSTNGTSAAPTFNTSVSVSGNTLNGVTEAMQFDLSGTAGNYKLAVTGQTTDYLYTTATNNGVRVGTNANNLWTIAQHESNANAFVFKCNATSRYLGVYNNQDWRCYDGFSVTNFTNGKGSSEIYLYKKQSGPVVPDTTPSMTVEETLELTYAESEGTINVTYKNLSELDAAAYSDAGCTADCDWLIASWEKDAVSYLAEANEGEERTAYIQIYALDADINEYTKVITVTQQGKASEVEIQKLTVAEFLETEVDDNVLYELEGTITSVANTLYGNFDLTDDTGTVYIYGLCSEDGATNQYWSTSGAKLGDDIVIRTIRAEFNGTAQGKNARFVELTSPGTRAFYTLNTEAIDFASSGGEQVVTVTAYNTDAAVTASSDNDKFTVTVNDYNVTISSVANELEEKIEGNVTVKVGNLEDSIIKVSLAAKPASGVVEGGQDDFNTISATNTSYVSGKTTAGWAYTNCAIFKGGTSDSSPAFKMIGDASNRALCMNGKTSAKGTITSPTLTTGCGTLKFNYGLPFGDTKIKFSVQIKQNGNVVKEFTVEKSSATKLTKYSFEGEVNVSGDFQIVFSNLSPSNSTSNKDRTAIWDVEWTGCN